MNDRLQKGESDYCEMAGIKVPTEIEQSTTIRHHF